MGEIGSYWAQRAYLIEKFIQTRQGQLMFLAMFLVVIAYTKRAKTSPNDFFFIQDCPFNKIDSILRQADEIGLISDYHNYLITNMVKARLFSFMRTINC